MEDNNLENLIKEFKDAGATEGEAEEFAYLSKNLSNFYSFRRSTDVKDRFLRLLLKRKTVNFSRMAFISAMFSFLLFLGFSSTVFAQDSLPGEILYPLKRFSESLTAKVNPSFKSVILQRRSEEVNKLTSQNQSEHIDEAINDYEEELNENEKISKEAIDESKKNLEEAGKKVNDSELKDSIEKMLEDTEKREEDLDEDVKGNSSTKKDENSDHNDNENSQQDEDDVENLLEH